jgi:acetophenone carboxylase
MKKRITENLDIDIETLEWRCHECDASIGKASDNYKEGCLVAARDPRQVWRPLIDEEYNFSFDPAWMRLVEYYCPGCGGLIEVDVLPPGHPIPHDIELDLEQLVAKARAAAAAL